MSRWAHVMCRAPVYGKVSPYYNRSYCGDWKVVNVLTSSLSPPPPTYVLPPPSLSCHNVSDFASQVSSLSSSHNLSPPHLQHHFLAAPVIPNALPCLTPSLHGFSAATIITTMMMMWQSPYVVSSFIKQQVETLYQILFSPAFFLLILHVLLAHCYQLPKRVFVCLFVFMRSFSDTHIYIQ